MSDLTTPSQRSRDLLLSRGALVLGTVLLALAFMDSSHAYGIPFPMPRFWYVNRTLWVFFGFLLFPIAWVLLKRGETVSKAWEPSRSGTRFRSVTLYSRAGCHLCDEAQALLSQYQYLLAPIREVDIDDDPALRERFSTSVPVVECDGKIRFRGRINEILLRRLIEGTPPMPDRSVTE